MHCPDRRRLVAGLALSTGVAALGPVQALARGGKDPVPEKNSRCVGLIGGLGPPSTIFYYENLLRAFAQAGVTPRLLIDEADLERGLAFVQADDRAGLARYLAALIDQLAAGGAQLVAMAAVTPHLCMPQLAPQSRLPIVDIITAIDAELRRRGAHRVALLGNRYTMAQRLYGRLTGFELIEFGPDVVSEVHRIYLAVVANGGASSDDLAYLRALCARLVRQDGVDTIIVGGTELSIVLKEGAEPFPLLDCSLAHIRAIVARATA